MSWLAEFLGLGPKARAYLLVKWQVLEGAFHFYAERCVRQAGLKGWMRLVKHPMYEYLELEVEGPKVRIDSLIEKLRMGPPNSKATGLEVSWKTYKGEYADFRTRV